MTITIVELLEMIDVDHEQAQAQGVAVATDQSVVDQIKEMRTIDQSGQ